MDDLERLLNNRRAELNAQEQTDADRGWSELRVRLLQQRVLVRIRNLRWGLGVAASLLLLVVAAWWWSTNESSMSYAPTLVSYYAPELYAEERAYLTTIKEKQVTLHLDRIDSTLFASFLDELRLVDSLQRTDLDELPQNGVNDRSLRALIRYYQTKLQLLELLENELLKQKQYQPPRADRSL